MQKKTSKPSLWGAAFVVFSGTIWGLTGPRPLLQTSFSWLPLPFSNPALTLPSPSSFLTLFYSPPHLRGYFGVSLIPSFGPSNRGQVSQRKGRPPTAPRIATMFLPLRKSHPLLKFANGSLIDLPSPANISSWWNFGSLLGMCLGVQIVTGLFLAMHYVAHIDYAFACLFIFITMTLLKPAMMIEF